MKRQEFETKSLCAALVVALTSAIAAPARAEFRPVVTGGAETVFAWSAARCEAWDIPDTPARAWRDGTGRVHLVAGAERSRAATGASLDALTRDCTVLHEGSHADDPGAYDDRVWIAATYALGDGVEALAHVEYHGDRRPALCPAGEYRKCWRNAIVALVSEDGKRFARPGNGRALVAGLPWTYSSESGQREGYFSPSNIFRRGDHLYVFVFAEGYQAQKRGACLLRRPVDGTAADWRAWDGKGFSRRFADPYREPVSDPGAHVCEPVPGIRSTLSSVVWHEPSGSYLAVTAASPEGPDGQERPGIYWTISDDLIHWRPPELLLDRPLLWRRDCNARASYAYPALLDPDAPGRNFETVDGDFWLYLVEMPLAPDCMVGPERNLVRFPVSLRA